MQRSDYSKIFWRTFGKNRGREACRQGWERWQAIWRSKMDMLVLHPPGAPLPDESEDDRFIIARNGPLRFVARASREHFPTLPGLWLSVADKFKPLGDNPRSAARAFVVNALVDGHTQHPSLGPTMACAIAWLIASSELGEVVREYDYRLIGYDISFVPGPPGKPQMFNFRAVVHRNANVDAALGLAQSLPLPEWEPPPD
jgi:hypothetical protein